MKALRLWSVRHAGALERVYDAFMRLAPRLRRPVALLGRERAERLILPVEHIIKGGFFDCRLCGQCTLSSSGMACPMNCPKQIRNGPCGGVSADGACEVDPTMRCVWLESLDGAGRMAATGKFANLQPPLDHRRSGTSAWVRAITGDETPAEPGSGTPPAGDTEPGALERACRSGRFVVTAELSPPDSADPADILKRAAPFRGLVDAVNVTDSAGANCHMSSLAAASLLVRDGYEPVFQTACRDRNRIAIQADLVGAAALGIRNVLAVTGDGVANGDHPQARPVFDLDAVGLLGIARGLRDRGQYASGRPVSPRPRYFLGATVNPFAPPHAGRVLNFEKKVAAGAQFVQTQYCFDLALLESFLREARARDLHRRCRILVGVGPVMSARTARWMMAHVPGVHIPGDIVRRLEQAADPRREGVQICVEIIRRLRAMDGVAGVHIMAHRNEQLVPQILEQAGLSGRGDAGGTTG